MIQKLIKNAKISLILAVVLFLFFGFAENFAAAANFMKESWWFWLVLPFFLRFYNWFRNLKQKAFDYGADTSGEQAERKAVKKDIKEKFTETTYKKLLAEAAFSKEEAEKIWAQSNPESLKIEEDLGPDYAIPLHRYVSGLTGNNLIRPSELKFQFTIGKISNGQLAFFHAPMSDFEKSTHLDKKFAEIPLAAIRKIEIIDLAHNRELKRVGAYVGQKVAQAVVNAASQTGGATVTKDNVPSAQLVITYINKHGVVLPATFEFNSNSKFGVKAMGHLKTLNKALKNYSLLGKLHWQTQTLTEAAEVASDMDTDDDFDISDVTALAGDLITVLKWSNMLSPHDSAVMTAKLSAEMIAGILQDSSVQLIETTK